jgi:hypothetical protein
MASLCVLSLFPEPIPKEIMVLHVVAANNNIQTLMTYPDTKPRTDSQSILILLTT